MFILVYDLLCILCFVIFGMGMGFIIGWWMWFFECVIFIFVKVMLGRVGKGVGGILIGLVGVFVGVGKGSGEGI